tara:strand:+ start:108 stop:362 length:255 start_codon:yes stop_codon:yes gene_type:complete
MATRKKRLKLKMTAARRLGEVEETLDISEPVVEEVVEETPVAAIEPEPVVEKVVEPAPVVEAPKAKTPTRRRTARTTTKKTTGG